MRFVDILGFGGSVLHPLLLLIGGFDLCVVLLLNNSVILVSLCSGVVSMAPATCKSSRGRRIGGSHKKQMIWKKKHFNETVYSIQS